MKIAYITMQFPSPPETFATNDVAALQRIGHQMLVFSLRTAHSEAERLKAERSLEGVRIDHQSMRSLFRGLALAFRRPLLLARTVRWLLGATWRQPKHLGRSLMLLPRCFEILGELERTGAEVVHVYWGHYPCIVGYLVRRALPGVVVSISLAAYDLTYRYGGSVRVVREADIVRTLARVNVAAIHEFTGRPEAEIHVIPDGVNIGRFEPKLQTAEGRRERISKRIVTVGRLVDGKGMDAVLRTFARVRRRWSDATLAVVGDGPQRTALENMAVALGVREAVEFLGSIDHDRVIDELLKAEVFLLLSRARGERLPNVVKEGMLCGCVCIASHTTGMEELVQHGESGFIVPLDDVDEAARLTHEVFSGRVSRASLTAAATQHIRQHFDLKQTTYQYVRLWEGARGGPQALASGDVHEMEQPAQA